MNRESRILVALGRIRAASGPPAARRPGRLDQRVRDRVVSESHGNPLSLLALARGLAPAELVGGFALPDVMPLVNRIEQGFVRRLGSLPAPARRLLLIAAAELQQAPGRGRYGSMRVPSRALRVT